MPGWKHHPYTITCEVCGKTRKSRSLARKYCTDRCRVVAARTRQQAVRTRVEEIKQEVSDAERRTPSGGGAPEGEPQQQAPGGDDPGAGVRERPDPAPVLQEEAAHPRMGRPQDIGGARLLRSPASGLLYLEEPPADETECIGCGDLFFGVKAPYTCYRCAIGGTLDD